MLRSVQLRHHRGPLYTIPYSSMGEIENHSRDWVKIKFFLRVPVDTDLAKEVNRQYWGAGYGKIIEEKA